MLLGRFTAAMQRLLAKPPAPSILIAALSGGVDSVVLLYLLHHWRQTLSPEKKPRLLAAHLNHQLRGDASDQDQTFCRAYAATLDVPFATLDADVAGFAKSHRLGLEEAGRLLRQEFFQNLAGADGLVLTGHHAGDQVETILMRLHRGAHRRGLAGMREDTVLELGPGRRLRLGRPLLGLERADILAYARANKLAWREDASNTSGEFFRNRIRNRLVPLLENWLPGFGARLRARAVAWAEEERIAGEAAADLLHGCCRRENGGCFVDLARGDGKSAFEGVPDEVVRHALRSIYEEEAGITLQDGGVLPRLFALLQTGRLGETLCLPGGVRARREHDGLFFFRAASRRKDGAGNAWQRRRDAGAPEMPVPELVLPEPPFCLRHGALVVTAEYRRGRPPAEDCRNPGVEWLSLAAVRFPLVLRPPRPGERLLPLGAKGGRKIQDLLVDAKIPRRKRSLARVLADCEGCLWLWPLRLAERARIRTEAEPALRVAIREEQPPHSLYQI